MDASIQSFVTLWRSSSVYLKAKPGERTGAEAAPTAVTGVGAPEWMHLHHWGLEPLHLQVRLACCDLRSLVEQRPMEVFSARGSLVPSLRRSGLSNSFPKRAGLAAG